MASKGMSMTLTIIVAAVVILVTALVLLTMLGGSITPLASLTDARNTCKMAGKPLCETTGGLPPTWDIPSFSINNVIKKCSDTDVCGPASVVCVNKEWKTTGHNCP
jgi:hypothetical protein